MWFEKVEKEYRNIFDGCVDFLFNKYDLNKFRDKLIINYREVDELKFYGSTVIISKNEIVIDICVERNSPINDYNVGRVLETICHEFIHFKQIIRGDLKTFPNHVMWKGDVYNHEMCLNLDIKSYEMLPWEEEAYYFQNKLFVEFCSFL